MGAALTYARRYGLFTLVGIAGEDDLDAPDLNEPNVKAYRPRIISEITGNCGRQVASSRPTRRGLAKKINFAPVRAFGGAVSELKSRTAPRNRNP